MPMNANRTILNAYQEEARQKRWRVTWPYLDCPPPNALQALHVPIAEVAEQAQRQHTASDELAVYDAAARGTLDDIALVKTTMRRRHTAECADMQRGMRKSSAKQQQRDARDGWSVYQQPVRLLAGHIGQPQAPAKPSPDMEDDMDTIFAYAEATQLHEAEAARY